MKTNKMNNNDYISLKPVNLKELYKTRDYENFYLSSILICKLSILINMIVIVYRIFSGVMKCMNNSLEISNIVVLGFVILLHFLIILFSFSSIKILKYRN